ncbi:hypothetical protein HELRODRAFT_122790, partial [Helobdella robusta]|uniref:Mab-21-like nucleotidyltransferase domain-containing protein n=1 Tax=Helobdella robusta TaxID=6412 RepID=T1EGV9_HELRO
LDDFYLNSVLPRRYDVMRNVTKCLPLVTEILNSVEKKEPRFKGIYCQHLPKDGIRVLSAKKFEIFLYLNPTGAFSVVELDNFSPEFPGTAAMKLGDGRKRSMSLWVEFITASGFLSARKLRSRFRNLVISVLSEKRFDRNVARLVDD